MREQEGAVTDTLRAKNFYLLGNLMALREHGARFLDPAELESTLKHVAREYYERLGRDWLKQKAGRPLPDRYWEFQRKYLELVGERVQPTLLARLLESLAQLPAAALNRVRNG